MATNRLGSMMRILPIVILCVMVYINKYRALAYKIIYVIMNWTNYFIVIKILSKKKGRGMGCKT